MSVSKEQPIRLRKLTNSTVILLLNVYFVKFEKDENIIKLHFPVIKDDLDGEHIGAT